MRSFYIVIYSFLFLLLFSCSRNNEIEITGKINKGANKWLWLYEINPAKINLIDSININDKEKFIIETRIEKPTFLRLRNDKKEDVFLIVKPGEEININADYEKLEGSYDLEGSYESILLREYMKQFNFSMVEKRKIAASFYSKVESGYDVLKAREESIYRHDKLRSEIREFTMSFIKKNKCFLASIFILDLQLGPKDPILTVNDDYEYFKMVDSCLSENYPDLEIVQEYNRNLIYYNENKDLMHELKPGSKVPEIVMQNVNGDTIKLSDLKGKIVLIDFWASWNKKCRLNNKKLLSLYSTYHKKGFEIYQISLDKSKKAWNEAVEQDSIQWISVSDLKFWNSHVVKIYNVYNIPMNYFIDKEGRIIQSNIEISELDNRLAHIFN